MDYKRLTKCRVCGNKDLKKYLDLGLQPLPNALFRYHKHVTKKYPLVVLFCNKCYLSQLSIIVKPNILYSDYPYHSSVSKTFQDHCYEMAIKVRDMLGFGDDMGKPLVVDIASNDGCLLNEFKRVGFTVIGVEPCKNLSDEANKKGISTVNEFWGDENVIPPSDIITATNVFAHVHDIVDFLKVCYKRLRVLTKGILVVEVPYLPNMIEGNQFDTIYHEHLSYFLLKPLMVVFRKCGLQIFKVERVPIHGGSIRVYASRSEFKREVESSVIETLEYEKKGGYYRFNTYKGFSKKVEKIRDNFVKLLEDIRDSGQTVLGYGASAKGAMLMNYCKLNKNHVSMVIDDTREKQYKYIPGCGICIGDFTQIRNKRPDYMVLFAWNFAKEIMEKTGEFRRLGGKYIVPIPSVKVL